MPKILNQQGLFKLKEVQEKCQQLLSNEYMENASSEYSINMVNFTLSALDELVSHNDFNRWKKWLGSNHDKMGVIDANSGTYIPVIFNQQSLDLAIILNEFLQQFDSSCFTSTVKAPLKLFLSGEINDLKNTYQQQLQANISFYQGLLQAEEIEKERIKHLTLVLQKIDEITNNKEVDIEKYTAFVNEILEKTQSLPYLRMLGMEYKNCINTPEPKWFNPDEINGKGAKSLIFLNLLTLEETVNEVLTKQNPDHAAVTLVYDKLQPQIDQNAYEELQSQFTALLDEFNNRAKALTNAKHLGIFQSRNPKKEELMKALTQEYRSISERDDVVGFKLFECYQETLRKIQAHEKIIAKANISLGKTGELLNYMSVQFLSLWQSIDVKTDPGMTRAIEKYEENVNVLDSQPEKSMRQGSNL